MKKHLLLIAACFTIIVSHAQNAALSFNGSTQYISIPDQNSIDLSTNFSLEGWIYPTGPGSQPTEGGMILNKESSYEIARFADGTIRYAFSALGTGTDWGWTNTGIVAPLNTWSHFALVKAGTIVTAYLNGVSTSTVLTGPAVLIGNSQELRLANRTNAAHYFNGSLDEVRIWNTVRTPADIKTNMFNRNLSNNATGLVAYYRMNENTGSTTANASTNSTGINGTLVAAPSWVPSSIQFKGNALSFDGTGSTAMVATDPSLTITTAITLEAWVYATKNTGIQNVVCKSNNSTNTGYIFPRTDNGWAGVTSYLYVGGGWKNVTASFPSLNAWHHLAFTYDGLAMKIYIDGVLANSVAQTGLIAVNSNPLAFGNQPGFTEYFGGSVDEVRIWNIARTQAQLQINMNKELDPSLQVGLVSYYTFNQGITTGSNAGLTTVPDQLLNNNATLSGFTLSGGSSNFVAQFTGLSILPVSWLGFIAQKQAAAILLNWMVSNQQNTARFIIQHSTNGAEWTAIGNLQAAGNSIPQQQYSFTHKNPVSGVNYYRIQQVDLDGKFSYSKTIAFNFQGSSSHIRVYPNPVTNGILQLQLNEAAMVSIYTNSGLLAIRKQLLAGTQQLDISGLPKGGYQLKSGIETISIVLQ